MKPIVTHVAHAGFDDHRFMGRALYGDLLGRTSISGMIGLGLRGTVLDAEECGVLDDLAVSVCLADPRIWPYKAVRVASAFGGALPGVAAGVLIADSVEIGPWTSRGAAEVLLEIERQAGGSDRASIERAVEGVIARRGRLVGFGVPARRVDERVVAIRAALDRRGRTGHPYFTLMDTCATVMKERSGVEPNVAIAFAAAALDLGFVPELIGALATALWLPAVFANAVEGARQAPAILQEVPHEAVLYRGPPPRVSPRKSAEIDQNARRAEGGADD